MNISKFINDGEILITPDNPKLQYSGRIGVNDEFEPELIFPASFVRWHFKGTGTAIVISCKSFYWDAYAGCALDGRQLAFKLEDGLCRIELGHNLPDCDHIVTFYKRQDACNIFTIHGIILDNGCEIDEAPERPSRRIEVYGDSVSAGEVSEAVAYIAKPDPEGHNGCYSNSWFSYSWITARKLKAELHLFGQGGVSLMPGTGWFSGPDYVGLEQIYDKVKYYPDLEHATSWDFSKYTPHVVVVAIGQNDANPENFMKDDYNGDKSKNWRRHYRDFLFRLRSLYPKALIICTTTILDHDPAWDRAINEVVKSLCDDRLTHFLYSENGTGTPGHIRIPEAEVMAQELSDYITSFGDEIWED